MQMGFYQADVSDFSSEEKGARFLLHEASSILAETGLTFAIVGGWTPFLLCPGSIPHPGTFDVDVLLQDCSSRESIRDAAAVFESYGYLLGAKNFFQLHRLISIRGTVRIFHVDFLHRLYAPDQEDLTIDWGGLMSIAGPGSDLVFNANEKRNRLVELVTKAETPTRKQLTFPTEAAFIAMKARSMTSSKRIRDPFDIFLTIRQSEDRHALQNECIRLFNTQPVFKKSWEVLSENILKRLMLDRVVCVVKKQAPDEFGTDAKAYEEVEGTLRSFLKAVEDFVLPSDKYSTED